MNPIVLSLSALLLTARLALAADGISVVDVRFPPGKAEASIKGAVVGRASVSYRVGAEAGQTLSVALQPSNRATYFNLYAPGKGPGDEALASGEMTPEINQFSGELATSGVYTVNVFLYRSAARRQERSAYSIRIAVSPKVDLSAPVRNDFADGLQGGPDAFVVMGLGKNGRLRLRATPSASAGIVASLGVGVVVRNLGCRMAEGRRWCKVEKPDTAAGWVDGRFLRESAASRDALVPGTKFHATGEIPCAQAAGQPMRMCRFGVVRQGGGSAMVTVSFAGGQRIIRFEGGVATGSDGAGSFKVERNADLFVISIGDERYEIVEAVVSGG